MLITKFFNYSAELINGVLMQHLAGRIQLLDLTRLVLESMKKRGLRELLLLTTIAISSTLISYSILTGELIITIGAANSPHAILFNYKAWIIAVSILVSAITMFNSMMISVVERYRVIGIMKCLGAKNSFIFKMFLLESLILGIFGGFIGFAFSLLIFNLLLLIHSASTAINTTLPVLLNALSISILISSSISIIATLYPAHVASRLDPIKALRAEF